jgi:5-methylcytosine-specific restriction endonuclease McrBC regulatory subunit McrC
MTTQNSIVIDLKDNLPNQQIKVEYSHRNLLEKYSGLCLNELASLGIQTIPPGLTGLPKDEVGKEEAVYHFSKDGNSINTGNCMGIMKFHNAETNTSVCLRIKSRFDKGKGQPFLLYLLSKVFGGVFFDQKIESKDDAFWDVILAMMFRQKLIDACAVGMFRQYRLERHNDMRYRGAFDISRHLNTNIPFVGKIAYNTRDISYDNPLNHLVRYALNKISKKWQWLSSSENKDMNALSNQIMQNTPSWNPNGLYSCIMNGQNRNPVRHPLYAQYYEPLRALSLALLHDDGASPYDAQDNEVQGFLFEGAWLWEEYLNTILKDRGYTHAENKTRKYPIYLFETDKYDRYPDFFKEGFVLDAKYKGLDSNKKIDRDDMHQIIAYMYVQKAQTGGFIYPCNKSYQTPSDLVSDIGKLRGYGGDVKLISFPVPKSADTDVNYQEYAQSMKKAEDDIQTQV